MQKGITLVFEGGQILQTTRVSVFAFLLSSIVFHHLCKALSLMDEKTKAKTKHRKKPNNLLMSQAQLFYLNKTF